MALATDQMNDIAEHSSSPERALRIAQTLLMTFGIQGIGLLTGVLVARILGVHGRGELAAIILWPSAIAYLGDLGLPVAYTYESARDERQIPALVGNAVVASLLQWMLLSALGAAIIPVALHQFGPTVALTGIAFLIAYLPLNLLTRYLNALNQGTRAFGRFNIVRMSVPISYAAILGAMTLGDLRTVQWVIVATLVSNVCALVAAIITSGQRLRSFGRPRVDRSVFKRTLGYGVRAHLGNLTPVDSMQLDLLLVTALLGATDAGLYSVAISAAMVLRAQGTALGLVALPEVAAARTPQQQREATGAFFRLLTVMNVATAVAIASAAGLLVPAIYGRDFAYAVPTVRILTVGMIAASMRQLLGDCLRGAGKPLAGTLGEFAGWVVGLAALGALVPLFGITGAALGVSLSYAAALAVVLGVALNSGNTVASLFIPRLADVSIWRELGSSVFPRGLLGTARNHVVQAARRVVPLLGLFILVIGAGAGIAAVNPSERAILIGAIAFVLLLPLAMRIAAKQFDMFEPLTIACVALLVMFVGRPIALLVSHTTDHIGYDIMPNFNQALFVGLIGCSGFVIGYLVPFGRHIGEKFRPIAPRSWNIDAAVPFALGLFLSGLVLYALFIFKSGGEDALTYLLAGRQPNQDALYRSSTAYLYYGLFLSIPASSLLLASGLISRWRALIIVAGFMMLPLLIYGGATGGRIELLILLGTPAIFVFLYAHKRPGWLLTVVALYVGLTVGIGFLRTSRAADQRTESRAAILAQAVTDPGAQIRSLMLGSDTEMFDTLSTELSIVPSQIPYQHGAVVTDMLTRVVPRPVWPEKPLESNDRLLKTLWPQHYAVSRAAPASSIAGGLYQDSGLLSVFAGMLAIGVIARALWAWFMRWEQSVDTQLIYAATLPLFVWLLRGNVVSTVAIGAFTLLPLPIAFWLTRRSRERHERSLARVRGFAPLPTDAVSRSKERLDAD